MKNGDNDGVQTRRILLVDKIVSLILYGIAASAIAEVVGMPLASLLAVGGISGIAVGLAAKEVISNMFGGASIFLTRPFVVGEKIKVGQSSHKLYLLEFQHNPQYRDFRSMKMIIDRERIPGPLE